MSCFSFLSALSLGLIGRAGFSLSIYERTSSANLE